jgi:predicted restriction endonuclease
MAWKDEIAHSLAALGGIAKYAELYEYIETHPETHPSTGLSSKWQAVVRHTIEIHSSDSENYRRGREDVFRSVSGLGKGVWGLRSLTQPESPTSIVVEPLPPPRESTEVLRVVRDTAIIRYLKRLYANRCQICARTIHLRDGDYSEGHHLQPLGGEHYGPDVAGNIVIVCPNHHVEFDYGRLAIHPIALTVVHADPTSLAHGRNLRLHADHKLGGAYLAYQFERIFAAPTEP